MCNLRDGLLEIIKVNVIHDLSTASDPNNAGRAIVFELVQQHMCEVERPKVVCTHCDLQSQYTL